MASYRKRGKTWLASVRLKGVEQYATFPTKAEAVEWASELEKKVRQGQRPIDHRRTLGDLLERYSREVSPKKAGCKWEQTRLLWLGKQKIARLSLSQLASAHVAEWRDQRLSIVSGETIRRDMALLSHAMRVAVREWGWLHANPLSQVSRPRGNPHRERIATQEEIDRICLVAGYEVGAATETVQKRVAAAFVLACETGLRGGEIAGLPRYDGSAGSVVLHRTKNGQRREVPLSETAKQILLGVGDGFEGLTVRQKDALFRKIVKKAGITGLNFHDSRHTAITRLAKKLTVLELARMVGHRDLNQLLVYYNESAEEIAKRL